jgi:hypothetical protein
MEINLTREQKIKMYNDLVVDVDIIDYLNNIAPIEGKYPIKEIGLSIRAVNVINIMSIKFRRGSDINFKYLTDFIKYEVTASDIIQARNSGKKTLLEIEEKLQELLNYQIKY